MPPSTLRPTRSKKVTGLRYWMLQVLDECDRVAANFGPDPVHDLRVALRRCRSLADGLMALDPDPDWKAMKKAGKRLFQRLGALRDVQVMMEWVEKLGDVQARVEGEDRPAQSEQDAESGSRQTVRTFLAPIRLPGRFLKSSTVANRSSSAKRKRRSKSLTGNSGGSGANLFPLAPRVFGREARCLNISLSSAGPRPASCTIAPCAIVPKSRFTVSASASSDSATSWKTFFPSSTRPGATT